MRVRSSLAGLLACAVIAGCGGDDEGGAATPTATPESATRTWDNGNGTTVEIPREPRRVVFFDAPVGQVTLLTGEGQDRIAGYAETQQKLEQGLVEYPDSWQNVGKEAAPSIERIAALKPDVIVSYDGHEANEQLERIAPVAFLRADLYDWRAAGRSAGDLLGLSDEVDAYLAELDDRIAALAEQVDPDKTVSLVRVNLDGVGAYPGTYPTTLLDELGIESPPLLSLREPIGGDDCCIDISNERLDEIDADVLLVAVDATEDAQKNFDALQEDPLWAALGAVERGDAHVVNSGAWISWTLAGVPKALDDIERHVLE
jgi:iron complex transport system substrate-binding protein